MKKPPAIDANIILRFLTNDDPVKAEACAKLLEKVERNELRVWLPDLVLADIVWTLEKFYRVDKVEIAELLAPLVSLRGMHCADKKGVLRALSIYTRHNIDWTDAFVASQIISGDGETIYSYDRDFDKIEGIGRAEP